ncbi:Hypothetical protein FKW44_024184, partial [Caligus rogercresseyi]
SKSRLIEDIFLVNRAEFYHRASIPLFNEGQEDLEPIPSLQKRNSNKKLQQ